MWKLCVFWANEKSKDKDSLASMMEIMLGGNYKEESSGKLVF